MAFVLTSEAGCERLRVQEFCGSSELKTYLAIKTDKGTRIILQNNTTPTSVVHFFKSVFLPQGYPESVSEDYLAYQLWDTLQAFCSSITGTLATQAVLKGVGVGDEKATAAAATITWMMKDGTGMIGRILFAWLHGSSLDCEAKKWRLFADFLNDGALLLEMVAPNFPDYFIAFLCVASVAKSIVGVAGGATRAALTMHQARRNNMADVSAKDGSQETLVNLSALIVGLFLLPAVTGNSRLIWILFFLFTFLHLFANFQAVSSVIMETLNKERLHILTKSYLKHGMILSPLEISQRESVLMFRNRSKFRVVIGAEFSQAVSSEDCFMLLKDNINRKYVLTMQYNAASKKGSIYILLHSQSTSEDIIKAYFQAELLRCCFENNDQFISLSSDTNGNIANLCQTISQDIEMLKVSRLMQGRPVHSLALSYVVSDKLFPAFVEVLRKSGWVTQHTQLGANEWRINWDIDS